VLGQEAVEDKSNEIVAIPALLERLDLEGALVSVDAMGCNPAVAGAITGAMTHLSDVAIALAWSFLAGSTILNILQRPLALVIYLACNLKVFGTVCT